MKKGLQLNCGGIRWLSMAAGLLLAFVASADPVDPQDRMQLADGLFRRGLFDLAAKEYGALATAPDLKGLDNVLFRLAECQRRLNKRAEAEANYAALIKKYPESPHVPRARLQCALIQIDEGGASLDKAVASLEPLTAGNIPPEVRSAALFHLGQTFEKLNRPDDALARYEQLRKDFPSSDYALYSGLQTAWLLSQKDKPDVRRQAMGIYLELAHQTNDVKVAEESVYFAARLAFQDERYEESANLFQMLQTKFPQSKRIDAGLLTAASANYYAGRYQQASELLDRIVNDTKFPNREQVLYLKANCLSQMAKTDEAVAFYAKQLAEFADGKLAPQAWFEELSLLYRSGKYADALKLAGQRVPPPEAHADQVYWIAAQSANAITQSEAVVQNCKLLVEKCPKSPFAKDALYELGWLQNKQGAWESAASWFLQVVKLFPADPLASKALYSAGVCHARLGQRDVALRDWTDLLTKYPQAPEAADTLYQKAMEELRGKDFRAASATLDERIRRFPDDERKAEVFYWRASISRQLNEPGEAEKGFRAALAAAPSKEIEHNATLELGIILYQLERKPEAAALFQKLLDAPVAERMGEDRLAWLATFQCDQKQYDSAEKAAKILIDMKPDKGWLQTGWTLLGRVLRARNERDAAIHAFDEALKTGASTEYTIEASLRLGEMLSDTGHYDDAAKHLGDAAERASAPDQLGARANAYMALARNEERRGSNEQAVRYYLLVGLLFDDAKLVPEALSNAATLLDKLGRPAEAQSTREELKKRYPQAPAAKTAQCATGAREVA